MWLDRRPTYTLCHSVTSRHFQAQYQRKVMLNNGIKRMPKANLTTKFTRPIDVYIIVCWCNKLTAVPFFIVQYNFHEILTIDIPYSSPATARYGVLFKLIWPLGDFNKFELSNFQFHFSDWWLGHLLWNSFQVKICGHYWWWVNIGSGHGLVP